MADAAEQRRLGGEPGREGGSSGSRLLKAVTFKASTSPAGPGSTDTLVARVFGSKNAPNQRVSESLDYEPVQNKIFYERMRQAKKERHLFGYTGHTLAKFVITMVSGVLTGACAVALSTSVASLFEWKNGVVQHLLDEPGSHRVWVAFLWHCGYSCLLASFAVALVQYWAPQAAGAGVTLVMAYLNGNHVPNLLRLRTLTTKLVGTICAVGAGFPMGPEGPMVHIGACLASVITYAQCTCLRTGRWLSCCGRRLKSREAVILERMKVLDDIVSDSDHREFISAGTAAGISAAFGAPIGGVLFAMEEACSFWNRKTSWRCFIAAVCSTFTLSQMSRDAQHGMIAFTGVQTYANRDWLMQLPFILINAGVAGLLGAAFNSMRMWLWRLRASKTRHVLRIAEVIGLALMCCSTAFCLAWAAGRCIPKHPDWGETYGLRFQCEEGSHNDLATLFLSSSHHTIINLFSMGHSPGEAYVAHFTQGSLALFVVAYLVLMSVGAGVAIPGGLFMPSIMVGAAWGGLWGSTLRAWIPAWNIQPGVYGIMAASSVLAGVFRSNVSLVVLVVEGTRGIEFMFGIILSVVVANWVAHHIHHDGVYESELERIGNLYFLRDEPPHRLHTLTTEMIMATGVVGFRPVESVASVLAALGSTSHNGFPIAMPPSPPQPGPGAAGAAAGDGFGGGGSGGPIPHARGGSFGSLVSLAQLGGGGGGGGSSGYVPAPGTPPGADGAADGPPPPPADGGAGPSSAGAGGSAGAGVTTCEGGRLEGVILRSQLLVLLQRRHFCDQHGRPVGREYCEKQEIELETEMRTFFRRYFTHNRYVSATATPLEALQLTHAGGLAGSAGAAGADGSSSSGISSASAAAGVDLGSLFIDMRPYMNRSPFTVRRDCSASRTHQAFVLLGMRHLIVVDAQNRIVGIVTRKDLDHAAGHGWWRMSAQAPRPNRRPPARPRAGINKLLDNSFFRGMSSVNFLTKLVAKDGGTSGTGGGLHDGGGNPGGARHGSASSSQRAPYEVTDDDDGAGDDDPAGGASASGGSFEHRDGEGGLLLGGEPGDGGASDDGCSREPSGFFRAFRAHGHGHHTQQHAGGSGGGGARRHQRGDAPAPGAAAAPEPAPGGGELRQQATIASAASMEAAPPPPELAGYSAAGRGPPPGEAGRGLL